MKSTYLNNNTDKIIMNIELSNTINEVVRFTNLHNIEAVFQINSVKDLLEGGDNQDERWRKFEKKAGVYLFIPTEEQAIHYIGMSEKDVGTRVFQWLVKENKVSNEIKDKKKHTVLTISLENQPYMSPALESYLITKLEPKLNIMKKK